MEKQSQELFQPAPHQQQQPLRCPRCDSSNTKFCYYNNYSLAQPRHFCKACKRYWTRGGTLRNVPVGGGCRKNKRIKRPADPSVAIEGGVLISVSSSANSNSPSPLPKIDVSSTTSNHINPPLFYGLPSNPSVMNLPFPSSGFNSTVVSSSTTDSLSGYDLQPQMGHVPGLGFSSGTMTGDADGLTRTKQIQDLLTPTPFLASSSIFSSSPSTTTTAPSIATLLASSPHQNKFTKGIIKDSHSQNLVGFEDLQLQKSGHSGFAGVAVKELKLEQGQNRMDWNVPCQDQIDQVGFPSDPSLYWNTSASVCAWHDPANIGSSVTSLI